MNIKSKIFFFLTLASFRSLAIAACADADMDEQRVIFYNNCNYTVYWNVNCATPGTGCYGNGRVILKPNDTITNGYPAAVIIYGPYKY